jgi:hypothetical protein
MKKSFHNVVGRAIITVATGLSALVLSSSLVMAGNANPQSGYESLFDNITDKGANNGRCNAIGVLASIVCDTTGDVHPSLGPITEACGAIGITVETYCDPDPTTTTTTTSAATTSTAATTTTEPVPND